MERRLPVLTGLVVRGSLVPHLQMQPRSRPSDGRAASAEDGGFEPGTDGLSDSQEIE
jgi:hypothetical protein